MERNKEYFEGRLNADKETFTRDEVAGLLHSEAEYSTRTATTGMVKQEDYDSLQADYTATKEQLVPYKDKEFKELVSTEFTKLNGISDRSEDLLKLTGITKEMKVEEIAETIAKTKESGNYNFLFTSEGSGGSKSTHTLDKIKSKQGVQPQTGGNFFASLFNKKKK